MEIQHTHLLHMLVLRFTDLGKPYINIMGKSPDCFWLIDWKNNWSVHPVLKVRFMTWNPWVRPSTHEVICHIQEQRIDSELTFTPSYTMRLMTNPRAWFSEIYVLYMCQRPGFFFSVTQYRMIWRVQNFDNCSRKKYVKYSMNGHKSTF